VKILHFDIEFIGVPIVFIYTKKKYAKYAKKHNIDEVMDSDGMTTVLLRDDNISFILSVRETDDHIETKPLIVHEISHIVTQIMLHFHFDCDEIRSYLVQFMYLKIMTHYDKGI